MQLHLYRPVTWWRGGEVVCLDDHSLIPADDAAALIRLGRATFIPDLQPFIGEPMSDDASSELRLVSGPVSEPITLAQAKTFLRVEHTGDDDAITRAIAAARQFAESYLRMALLPQVWDYTLANPCGAAIRLPFGPGQSITSVTLVNEAGESSVMNAANYRLSVDGYTVIFTHAPRIENLTVRYNASSATTVSDVPFPIIQGMLHHIAVMMENRDGMVALPMQAMSCYQPYRRVSL